MVSDLKFFAHKGCIIAAAKNVFFHRIGPMGRFGLVVAMYVSLFVTLFVCPLPMQFFASMDWCGASLVRGLVRSVPRPWTGAEPPLTVDWCGASLALAWSPKNGEVFRIGLNVLLTVGKRTDSYPGGVIKT